MKQKTDDVRAGYADRVYSYLREQIINGNLRPGEKLVESRIAEQLSLSRGPVRDALKHLALEGLVDYQTNRGCSVALLSPKDAYEVFFMRGSLEKLALEKENTGVYITGHPLDEFREELMSLKMNSNTINTEVEESDDKGLSLDGTPVLLGGIISEVRPKATKKNDLMAFVTIEDYYGSIECLIFPRTYDKYRSLCAVDTLIAAEGKLSVREDDAPKLLIDSLIPLGKLNQPQMKLFIKVADEKQRDEALKLLGENYGDIALTIAMGGKAYAAPKQYWVNADTKLDGLKKLLGEKYVVLKQV